LAMRLIIALSDFPFFCRDAKSRRPRMQYSRSELIYSALRPSGFLPIFKTGLASVLLLILNPGFLNVRRHSSHCSRVLISVAEAAPAQQSSVRLITKSAFALRYVRHHATFLFSRIQFSHKILLRPTLGSPPHCGRKTASVFPYRNTRAFRL